MATKKISQLPLDTAVTGPDLMPIVSDGATKRVTLTTLSGFFSAAGPTGATGPSGAGEAYQGATAPASASAGATWLNTDDGRYHTRYDGLWIEVGGPYQ